MAKESTEVRQKQIIAATLAVLAEKGISGLTTAEVAKRVGFSEAALFRHFPSKVEMIKATILWAHDAIFEAVLAISRQDLEPVAKLEEILAFQLGFIEQNRGMSRIIFSDELHIGNADLKETVRTVQQRYAGAIAKIIKEAVAKGVFRPDLDVNLAVRTFFGLIQTSVLGWSLNDFGFSLKDQYQPLSDFIRTCFS